MPETPSKKCVMALAFEATPRTPTRPMGQDQELEGEIAAIVEFLGPDIDWRRSIFEYFRHKTIPDNLTETQCLPCQAKGYQIHNDELYHHSTSSVLQWCIPTEEGKALLLDIHEGICGHHASSRSMVRKIF
jgi:hypothetical protein